MISLNKFKSAEKSLKKIIPGDPDLIKKIFKSKNPNMVITLNAIGFEINDAINRVNDAYDMKTGKISFSKLNLTDKEQAKCFEMALMTRKIFYGMSAHPR